MKEKAVVGRRSSYNSRFNEHFVVNKEFLQRDELYYIALQSHIPFIVNIAKEILEFILDYSCIQYAYPVSSEYIIDLTIILSLGLWGKLISVTFSKITSQFGNPK